MRRSIVLLALAAFGFVPARALNQHVDIQDFKFTPQTVTVAAGDTVDWINLDSASHTVTSDSPGFDSGILLQNGTFSFVFATIGSFPYHCMIHPTMTGTVTVGSPISASPSNLNFGSILVNTTSDPQTVTVTNNGSTGPYTIDSVTLDGDDPGQYATQADGCTGAVLSIGGSCTVDVVFSPTILGSPLIASLLISSDATGSPAIVQLTGNSVSVLVPGLQLSGDLDFGFQKVGTQSEAKTVTLTSNGLIPLHVASVTRTGADAADFITVADGCSGGVFAPGQTCDVAMAMTASRSDTEFAQLVFVTDAPSSPDAVDLSGRGDGIAPVSTFVSASPTVLGLGTSALFGSTIDDGSGVASVKIDFGLPVLGTTETKFASVTCATPNSCEWTVEGPATPGVYLATATATDAVGNVEPAGPSILIVVL